MIVQTVQHLCTIEMNGATLIALELPSHLPPHAFLQFVIQPIAFHFPFFSF